MEIIVSESITARLVTDKPIRKTPYQVKGVFMKQFPDEKIVPFLDGRLRSKYLYPRVQVKIINEQIYILGINEGVQSVISLLKNLKSFSFGDLLVNVDDAEVEENKDSVLLTDNLLRYKFITPWVALNAGGGSKYKRLEDNEKPLFLNKLLGQNLLFLSKELGLNISTKIFTKVEVESLEPEKVDENGWQSFKGEFKTNFILPSFIGFGNGATGVLFWSMLPDTIEYGEWKTGIRTESSLYGFMTFAQKGAIAIAAVILGMILTNIGFEPNQDQTQETLSSLKALMSLIPLIGVSISLVLVYFYPIDRNFHKKLIEDIENRKIQNV